MLELLPLSVALVCESTLELSDLLAGATFTNEEGREAGDAARAERQGDRLLAREHSAKT